MLKLLVINEYALKDSFDFVNRLRGLCLQNAYMLSFDVDALFTNVPLLETIDLILERI